MTDDVRTPDPAAALHTLPRGTAVIFRHYAAADRAALGRRLRALARRLGLVFIVAGDWRLARRLGADGLHLPAAMTRRRGRHAPRGEWRPGRLTAAAHDLGEVRRALAAGADMVLLSPVFPTASHPDARPLGHRLLARAAWAHPGRVAALGGVSADTLRRVLAAGAAGVAGIAGAAAMARNPRGLRRTGRRA